MKQPGKAQRGAGAARGRDGWLKVWCLRLTVAFALPLCFLVLLETGLRLAGYGHQTSFFIPGPKPGTLVSNPKFASRFFGLQSSRPPMPIVFTPARQPDSYRIFVFGSSAALGDPDCSTSFARILEAMLTLRFPGVRFEVVNTAMTAINSNVVLPIAAECARYRPDLYIVYTGNNEVIGPYGAGSGFFGIQPARWMIQAAVNLRGSRTGQLVNALAGKMLPSPTRWLGMQMFLEQRAALGDSRLERVYDHFEANLNAIADSGRKAGAEVMLCTLVTNLKDCPPFHSEHKAGLSPQSLLAWTEAWERGERRQRVGAWRSALEDYEKAAKLDDRYALLAYQMGQCHLALGDLEQARRLFERARDLDTFRFRADTRMNEVIRSVAGQWSRRGVSLVDADRGLSSPAFSADGIPGANYLYDHVHMNFAGNYAVAALLFPRVVGKVAAARSSMAPKEGPPTLAECAQWLVFTKFNAFEAAKSMAARMAEPPFTPEQGLQARGEMERRLAELTPAVIQQVLEQYRSVLPGRTNDLLLCANYANVLYVTGDNAGAVARYRELLGRYPYASDWQYFLGDSLAAEGKAEEAEKWLRRSLEQDPSNAEAQAALGAVRSNAGRASQPR